MPTKIGLEGEALSLRQRTRGPAIGKAPLDGDREVDKYFWNLGEISSRRSRFNTFTCQSQGSRYLSQYLYCSTYPVAMACLLQQKITCPRYLALRCLNFAVFASLRFSPDVRTKERNGSFFLGYPNSSVVSPTLFPLKAPRNCDKLPSASSAGKMLASQWNAHLSCRKCKDNNDTGQILDSTSIALGTRIDHQRMPAAEGRLELPDDLIVCGRLGTFQRIPF